MRIAQGTVIAGKIEVEGQPFADGLKVTIVASEPDGTFTLDADEESELLKAIEEADRGEVIPIDELFARLGDRT